MEYLDRASNFVRQVPQYAEQIPGLIQQTPDLVQKDAVVVLAKSFFQDTPNPSELITDAAKRYDENMAPCLATLNEKIESYQNYFQLIKDLKSEKSLLPEFIADLKVGYYLLQLDSEKNLLKKAHDAIVHKSLDLREEIEGLLRKREVSLIQPGLVIAGAGTLYGSYQTLKFASQKKPLQAAVSAIATSALVGASLHSYKQLQNLNFDVTSTLTSAEIIAKFSESYKVATAFTAVMGVSAAIFGAVKTVKSAKNKKVLPTIGFAAVTTYAVATAYLGIKNANAIGFENFRSLTA